LGFLGSLPGGSSNARAVLVIVRPPLYAVLLW
jgi:hypothetical protein